MCGKLIRWLRQAFRPPVDCFEALRTEPLKDRDGKERVASGQVLADGDLWKMDWYVDGVITQKK